MSTKVSTLFCMVLSQRLIDMSLAGQPLLLKINKASLEVFSSHLCTGIDTPKVSFSWRGEGHLMPLVSSQYLMIYKVPSIPPGT